MECQCSQILLDIMAVKMQLAIKVYDIRTTNTPILISSETSVAQRALVLLLNAAQASCFRLLRSWLPRSNSRNLQDYEGGGGGGR